MSRSLDSTWVTSDYRHGVAIFFGTARFYRPAACAMKYRRRNISMHVSYCVCLGGNREPRGRRKNYLTSKSSLRDARVTVGARIAAISRIDRFAVAREKRRRGRKWQFGLTKRDIPRANSRRRNLFLRRKMHVTKYLFRSRGTDDDTYS